MAGRRIPHITQQEVDEVLAALVVEDDGAWREHAECRGVDPDIFYPERGTPNRVAMAFCAACRVRVHCLAFAIRTGEKRGTWGGLSEKRRNALRRQLRQRAEGDVA